MRKSVEKGSFREDLYYRLSTVPIYVPPLRERGEDVLLLFRKFASDFSEKYRTKPIQLTEDAKIAILKYRFPGNIRQLKNLVEQMSVLEMERVINLETLVRYLPKENNLMPALYAHDDKGPEGFTERDLLYKVLFEMRKDVNDLKKLVHQMLQQDNFNEKILQDNQELFNGMHQEIKKEDFKPSTYLLDPKTTPSFEIPNIKKSETEEIEDITHETEGDENLSLEKKEKELIIKALRRNNNKRKYAAQDLGISERTLYRKIKQYELEDY